MRYALLLLSLVFALPASAQALTLKHAGRYTTNIFDESAAEIVVYDAASKRAFVVNGNDNAIDVLDVSAPESLKKITAIKLDDFGAGVNSVATHGGLVAAAVEADPKQSPGRIVVTDIDGNVKADFPAGALPDMVCFTPDGKYIVSANEGEPNKAYDNDPEGSITIVDISNGLDKAVAHQVSFSSLNDKTGELKAKGVRISGPKASVAQDLEPEYIAVSADSTKAFVTLQENNAIAVIDIPGARLDAIFPLGLKDWKANGWKMDPSNKDGGVNLQIWPVLGCYMPDSIAAYTAGDGQVYLITANEGDSREYGDYADEIRIAKAKLDTGKFPNAAELQDKKALGRLKVITDLSDTDGDGDLDRLVAFGARSFSIWSTKGELVFDSGDEFERIMAERFPENFNASNDGNDLDDRSDDKGPEPEGVAVGKVGGKIIAFIGLERMGGVMLYDVTDPKAPKFLDYVLERNFSGDPKAGSAGPLGPEGLYFVPAASSPDGKTPMLLVGSEVSGCTTIYQVVE